MTTATLAKSHADLLVPGAEHTTGTLLGGLRNTWTKYWTYRATLADLGDLTERQLADLGLARGEIRTTARRAVYGK